MTRTLTSTLRSTPPSTAATSSLQAAFAAKPPSWSLFCVEPVRAAMEYARMATVGVPHTVQGDGHAVVVFPGLASDQRATAPLVAFCNRLGWRACDWGLGLNTGPRGDVDAWLSELAEHVGQIGERIGGRMSLVGWSLGGVYAREVAKLLPGRVRQVVTIGTPFAGTETATRVGWLYRLVSGQPARITPELARRIARAPGVPCTSIYSRSDGVVSWQACLQTEGKLRENIEVEGSHCGMAWNPAVMSIVADRLAQPEGGWARYQARRDAPARGARLAA